MADHTTPPTRFIGCDVGKTNIVVFDSAEERTKTLANQAETLAAFAATLDDTCFVVCEATGGYEAELLGALCAAGRLVHRADARKVKAFIRSFGTLGKTDEIDARALAQYGRERHGKLPRWNLRDRIRDQLQALILTRQDFVAQRVATQNRLEAPGADPVRNQLEALLDCLTQQIASLDAQIAALIKANEPLAKANKILRDIAGIGTQTASALLALMPELGTLNRREVAALAGLAPHPRQSGNSDAYRHTRGGRPEVKKALFMAAISAARHDPKLKAFYENLLANGKKKMVAIIAVMRKLIVIANAKLRDAQATI